MTRRTGGTRIIYSVKPQPTAIHWPRTSVARTRRSAFSTHSSTVSSRETRPELPPHSRNTPPYTLRANQNPHRSPRSPEQDAWQSPSSSPHPEPSHNNFLTPTKTKGHRDRWASRTAFLTSHVRNPPSKLYQTLYPNILPKGASDVRSSSLHDPLTRCLRILALHQACIPAATVLQIQ